MYWLQAHYAIVQAVLAQSCLRGIVDAVPKVHDADRQAFCKERLPGNYASKSMNSLSMEMFFASSLSNLILSIAIAPKRGSALFISS